MSGSLTYSYLQTYQSEIYDDAFGSEMTLEWNTGQYLFDLTRDEMAYNRAICCFVRDGLRAEKDRRKLLQSYLKNSGFSADSQKDLINSWEKTLPSNNDFFKRVLRNIANVYNEEPTRDFYYNENPVPENDEKLIRDLLSECKYNLVMKNSHRKGKACGTVLAHPRIRNGQMQVQILMSDQYQVIKNESGVIKEVWIPFYAEDYNPYLNETTTNLRYEVWTEETVQIKDSNGNPQEFIWEVWKWDNDIGEFKPQYKTDTERKHNYKCVPFVQLNFDVNDNDGTESNIDFYELVKTQLDINTMNLLTRENANMAIGLWIMTNWGLDKDKIKLKHGAVLTKENISTDTGLAHPEASVMEIGRFFDEFAEIEQKFIKNAMQMQGLPVSLVTDNPGIAASGEAMKVDRLELEEIRKEDIVLLRWFEQELINMILIVANVDGDNKYKGKFSKFVNVSINYVDSEYLTIEQKNELIEKRKTNGTITVLEWYQYYTNDETVKTDADAIKKIQENLNGFGKITGIAGEYQERGNTEGDAAQNAEKIEGTGNKSSDFRGVDKQENQENKENTGELNNGN